MMRKLLPSICMVPIGVHWDRMLCVSLLMMLAGGPAPALIAVEDIRYNGYPTYEIPHRWEFVPFQRGNRPVAGWTTS